MKTDIINNEERRQWVLNDEGLYLWWQSTTYWDKNYNRRVVSIRKFITENKEAIDETIRRILAPPPSRKWNDYR